MWLIDGIITTEDLTAFSANITASLGGTIWEKKDIETFINSIDLGNESLNMSHNES